MKFEYDGVTEEREMAAFIDDDGDLCIRTSEGLAYLFQDGGAFYHDGENLQEYASVNGVRKAFYPGDKITITF